MQKILKIFKRKKVKRVLDLGSGCGRHIILLARHGFDVFGIDISEEGIKITKIWLKKKKLKANLKIASIYDKLKYPDGFFDAVISIQVLQHGTIEKIKKAVSEIGRVLRPGGIIFITVSGRYSEGKIRHCLVKTAKRIARNTYVPTIGEEKGLTHYIFNKEILRKVFHKFKILNIWKDERDYYCLLGELRKS